MSDGMAIGIEAEGGCALTPLPRTPFGGVLWCCVEVMMQTAVWCGVVVSVSGTGAPLFHLCWNQSQHANDQAAHEVQHCRRPQLVLKVVLRDVHGSM